MLAQLALTPESVAAWAAGMGWWGPLLLVCLIALESLLAPIPGWFLVAATGLLYGFWPGLVLSWVGACMGATLAFLLARHWGRRFLRRHIPEHIAGRLAAVTEKNGFVILLTARIVPYTALDILSYAAGLSGMRFAPFFLASALGFLPGTAALVAAGDQALAFRRYDLALYSMACAVVIIYAWRMARPYINRVLRKQ